MHKIAIFVILGGISIFFCLATFRNDTILEINLHEIAYVWSKLDNNSNAKKLELPSNTVFGHFEHR